MSQSILQKVTSQFSFYFGKKNYDKDIWLNMEAARSPENWVSLSKVLAFPKMKKIMSEVNVDDLLNALKRN